MNGFGAIRVSFVLRRTVPGRHRHVGCRDLGARFVCKRSPDRTPGTKLAFCSRERRQVMTGNAIETVVHEVHRLSVDVGSAFEDFRARYERAVPAIDASQLNEASDWEAVVEAAEDTAPLGFFLYWQADVTPLMRLAGDDSSCVEYLMGNHTIAQRMFHYDPAIMLYAPLRTAIHLDAKG